MYTRTRTRTGAALFFVAPIVFLTGSLAHPFVRSYLERAVVANAVTASPTRWWVAHLILAVGIGLLLLEGLAIRDRLRDIGEERWSGRAVTLLILGGTLLTALVGSEVTLAAVATSGRNLLAVMEAGETASSSLISGGALLFSLGWVSFGIALQRAPMLPGVANRAAIVALTVIPIGFLIPQTTGTYIYATALLVMSWLVGYDLIREAPVPSAPRAVN